MTNSGHDVPSSPSQRDVVIALGEIAEDAGVLAQWAENVLAALDSGDMEEAVEVGQDVDAMLDYTKRVELVEEWAAGQDT